MPSPSGDTTAPDDHVRERAERDADLLDERNGWPAVLLRVSDSALDGHVQESGSRHGRSPDVDQFRLGLVAHLVACLLQPQAQIRVLAVQEESLVEPTDLLERFAANEDAGT